MQAILVQDGIGSNRGGNKQGLFQEELNPLHQTLHIHPRKRMLHFPRYNPILTLALSEANW